MVLGLCTHRQACRSCCCKFLQGSLAFPNLPLPPKAEEDVSRHCLVPQQQKELGTVWRMWQMGESDAGQEASWSWRESWRVKEEEDKKMQTGRKNVSKAGFQWVKKEWSFFWGEKSERKVMGKLRNVNIIPYPAGGDTFQYWNGGSTLDA